MGGSGAVNSTPTSLPDDAAHVLVVDDDRRLRALLSSYLVKHGHRVTVAPTAAKARVFLDGLAFDIIVLDVMMPGESGFDFAADLRVRSQVPILMLTARGDPEDRVRGLEIGVDDYLAKPFRSHELFDAIERLTTPAPAPEPEGVRGASALAQNLSLLSQIETAIEGGDLKSIQALAGAVKGSVTSLIAKGAFQAASILADTAEESELSRAEDALRSLQDAVLSLTGV